MTLRLTSFVFYIQKFLKIFHPSILHFFCWLQNVSICIYYNSYFFRSILLLCLSLVTLYIVFSPSLCLSLQLTADIVLFASLLTPQYPALSPPSCLLPLVWILSSSYYYLISSLHCQVSILFALPPFVRHIASSINVISVSFMFRRSSVTPSIWIPLYITFFLYASSFFSNFPCLYPPPRVP